MSKIVVKRNDYKEHIFRGIVRPAYYECEYFFEGRKIAFYDSRDDTLYLNSDFIDRDKEGKRDRARRDETAYNRALSCKIAEAYKELFAMLGCDSETHFSEYIDL